MPELLGGILAVATMLAVAAGGAWLIAHSMKNAQHDSGGEGIGAAAQELDSPATEHIDERTPSGGE
ncbi:MAG: hypothetical protein CMJ58_13515 [Planctomycetaceae bacterium]|nr:hypothetical protein [Planctomycetaceae bacterium]